MLIRRDAWQRTPHISPPSLSHFPFLVSVSRCCLRPLLIFLIPYHFYSPTCGRLPIPIPNPPTPAVPSVSRCFFTACPKSAIPASIPPPRRGPRRPAIFFLTVRELRRERGGDPRAFVLGERLLEAPAPKSIPAPASSRRCAQPPIVKQAGASATLLCVSLLDAASSAAAPASSRSLP